MEGKPIIGQGRSVSTSEGGGFLAPHLFHQLCKGRVRLVPGQEGGEEADGGARTELVFALGADDDGGGRGSIGPGVGEGVVELGDRRWSTHAAAPSPTAPRRPASTLHSAAAHFASSSCKFTVLKAGNIREE